MSASPSRREDGTKSVESAPLTKEDEAFLDYIADAALRLYLAEAEANAVTDEEK